MSRSRSTRISILIWMVIILIDFTLVFFTQSTYDSGDSVLHYIQAKAAFNHPILFMDHWAKPIFVLMASPLAQLGWLGMKLFNALCMIGSAFLSFLIAKRLNLNPWIAVIVCFFSIKFILIQSSGLTEPLFTIFLIGAIFLEIDKSPNAAALVLSFLPFVRSEGLVIMLIYLVYAIIKGYKLPILLLLVGHVIYGLLGYFILDDYLWMFHQNPYQGVEEKYGHGDWLHYVIQLPGIVGLPIFILGILTLFIALYQLIKGRLDISQGLLLFGIPIGYFFAHVLFWRFGLFHSLGITRVLVVLIPFMAIHLAYLASFIQKTLSTKTYNTTLMAIGLVIVAFPFSGNKMAINFERDTKLEPSQQCVVELSDWLKENTLTNKTIWANNYFLPMLLDKDIYNPNEFLKIEMIKAYQPTEGHLVVWDSYFAVTDSEITKSDLLANPNLKMLKSFSKPSKKGNYEMIVFEPISDNLKH